MFFYSLDARVKLESTIDENKDENDFNFFAAIILAPLWTTSSVIHVRTTALVTIGKKRCAVCLLKFAADNSNGSSLLVSAANCFGCRCR